VICRHIVFKKENICGNSTTDHADKWMREVEKIFRETSCSKDKKLIFVAYLLSGEADLWWMGA